VMLDGKAACIFENGAWQKIEDLCPEKNSFSLIPSRQQ